MLLKREGNYFKMADNEKLSSGTFGSISWTTLVEDTMRASGDLKPNETITELSIDQDGITFKVET